MDPIQALRALELITAEQTASLSALADLDRAALDDLAAAIQASALELYDQQAGRVTTDNDLAALNAFADVHDLVRAEIARRPDPEVVLASLRARLLNEPPGEVDPPAVRASSGATPRVGRVAARRPSAVAPRAGTGPRSNLSVTTPAGLAVRDVEGLAAAFDARWRGLRGINSDGKHAVVTATAEWPADRRLGSDPERNMSLIAAATSLRTITAAGGICAPTPVSYDLFTLGIDDRPVRDQALVRFGADRGGIRFQPGPQLPDVEDGVGVWTHAVDLAPGEATKPCVTVACPDEIEAVVSALTRCLNFGNFRARFFPEQIEAWTRLLGVAHARLAELTILAGMVSESTAVTSGQILGAARDVLTTLDRATSQLRTKHRMGRTAPLRLVAPEGLAAMMRADLVRELPGSTDERLATADAVIDGFFRARAVNVTWSPDYQATVFGDPQGDGPLNGWPNTVQVLLYPEGSWIFLDGGTLDLGIVRDSTLNSTNQAQLFAETFEAAALIGPESQAITMDLCPDGSTSATADITPCDVGS